ncbi:MAG: DUF349 domain-containing protein [Flavobacteriaceae bacterium]
MLDEKNQKLQDPVEEENSATTDNKKESEKTAEAEPQEQEKPSGETTVETKEGAMAEIEKSNAEDAEDTHHPRRHQIPFQDYHSMPLENLVGELQRLVKNEKVQAIKRHVDSIKQEFDHKFQDFIEQKKEEYVSKGGNEADFKYNSVTKRQFNEVFNEYREKRNHYYKNLENTLKENLVNRLTIIEELKSLVNVEEDINTTYKNFKELQERWRNAGPVPRSQYNDVWRTYHHHIEIFYDFLHLNRELRDLDFKHNLEEKIKIVERAEALIQNDNINKAFRELQTLHKIWKEDIGPVDKEHREAIWERFSQATKAMHQRRQEHFKEQEKDFEKNLDEKLAIIREIQEVAENAGQSHRDIQRQIKQVESLREAFFKAGRVPHKDNDKTWASFKEAVRSFNRSKNAFYKNLKKIQQDNLDKKRALLNLAISLKDSEDLETTTAEMKRIQREWKQIGHVPRKFSDKIWNEFKGACNQYFDRLHATKNKAFSAEMANFEEKSKVLEEIKAFQLTEGKKEKDLETIKGLIDRWKSIGRVPFNKKNINGRFNKIIDAILTKLNVNQQESELLKYGNKIQRLASTDDEYAIRNERTFIRRKIDETKNAINQLENNLQFFSENSENNPLVQEVVNNINRQKETLETWKTKLKKLNIMQHSLEKEDTEEEEDESQEEE